MNGASLLKKGRRVHSRRFTRLLGAVALVCAGAAQAADPQPYSLSIAPTGDDSLDATLQASSQLESLRDTAAVGPFALIGRAREDIDRLKTVLESFGYYQARLAVTILGRPLEDVELPDALAALPNGEEAAVAIAITPGEIYHLRKITVDGEISATERAAIGLEPGQPANATAVLDAQARLLTALEEDGHAFATVDTPIAYEVPEERALDIEFHVVAGQVAAIGPITLTGMKRVEEMLVRARLLVRAGDPYSPSKLEEARRDLLALGVFSSVSIRKADHPDEDGRVPLSIVLQERLRHSLGFNAAYSSDLGGSVGVRWTDRDLFGGAEQLTLAATAIDLGGHATTGVGYNVSAQLTKPDFGSRDDSLQLNVASLKQSLDAYDQTAVTASALITHRFSAQWTVSVGVAAEREQITQQGEIRDYTLTGLPVAARFNSTGLVNPLLDAIHGMRASLSVTPTRSFTAIPATFVIAQAEAAAFFDLSPLYRGQPARSVLAVRALAGDAHGAAPFDLPPDQRFYGGGSGTVRGFRYQSIGPQFYPGGPPTGGTAVDAATAELRQRFGKNFGFAVFVDAGAVSSDGHLLQGRPSVGVGGGLRYYTPIGPIRLDAAVPVTKLPGGDDFDIYIGLGQSF